MTPPEPFPPQDDDLAPFLFGPDSSELSGFDERTYLAQRPHVVEAIARGDVASALDHFLRFGRDEPLPVTSSEAVPLTSTLIPAAEVRVPGHFVDAILMAPEGVFLAGWADDAADPLRSIDLVFQNARVRFEAGDLVRFRRRDVEQSLGFNGSRSFGICGFMTLDRPLHGDVCKVEVHFASDVGARQESRPQPMDDRQLRDTVLGYIQGLDFHGNKQVESFFGLDRTLGDQLVKHNKRITASIIAAANAETFGKPRKKVRGSIIVCLYGKPEFLFLQNALFPVGRGASDYEFIYVINSPEILESLHKEATISQRIYGLSQTIVALPGNAGFGAANNVAARFARSDRLLIVNPDVFPRDDDWAQRHTQVLDGVPARNTRLFGAPLYYADGSLMHAGMYCEADVGISVEGGSIRKRPMLRVEHYGKGAPPAFMPMLKPRPVPAVTGAFISVERAHFESLGGFSQEYIFGHYEDADLCFKSIGKGVVPWLHNVPFWHLEGKGGKRQPYHEGASTVNRWFFSRQWNAEIQAGLGGRAPNLAKLAGTT